MKTAILVLACGSILVGAGLGVMNWYVFFRRIREGEWISYGPPIGVVLLAFGLLIARWLPPWPWYLLLILSDAFLLFLIIGGAQWVATRFWQFALRLVGRK